MSDEHTNSESVARPRSNGLSLIHREAEALVGRAEAERLFASGQGCWDRQDYREAVRYFARCLRRNPNHAEAQFYIGLAYYEAAGLPDKDYRQAAISWWKAALQGNPEAQNNLARAYEQGHGWPKDDERAVYWFTTAAENGNATAQFNLAVMCELGRGVPIDLETAAAWYEKAAEQGFAPAQSNLGNMFRLGRGVSQDFARAAFWYRKAGEQNHPTAEFNLAVMYELGQGATASLNHAAYWYHRAAEHGEESARQCFVDVLKKLEESERAAVDGTSSTRT
jgi:uncharacterized protein